MDSHGRYKIDNIAVVYEDNWLMIIDKPAGLLTIPTPKKESRTLTSILNEDLKKRGMSYRLHPCHRLDRDTSGLIIYAKGKSVQKKMMDKFKVHGIKKTYIAFVQGVIYKDNDQIKKPIAGQFAITGFKVLERRQGFTIVEVTPLTGRKNQIRLHFKSIGHPVVGEAKFAFRKDYRLKSRRTCLHAKSLKFIHPVTQKSVTADSRLPRDLEEFLIHNR